MASKKVIELPVEDKHNDVRTFIPLGIVEGREPGPTLAVIGGVHASEYVAQDGALQFWLSLNPEEISGQVMVVLAADVTAVCAHHIYTNPVDGKNLNRTFPGKPDGTLAEVIAYVLLEEVIKKADAVIDCHGGEFDEYMALYLITSVVGDPEVDRRTLAMAEALGVPFIEVGDMRNPAYPWLGRGTADGEALLLGRPGMAIEAGERGIRDRRATAAVFNALQNALKHLGIMAGEPVYWAGKPVFLERGVAIKATAGGLFEPAVMVGDWIKKGDLFARVCEFDGSPLEEILAPAEGTVLTVISARAIKADGFAGKIGVVQSKGTA